MSINELTLEAARIHAYYSRVIFNGTLIYVCPCLYAFIYLSISIIYVAFNTCNIYRQRLSADGCERKPDKINYLHQTEC